MLGRADDCRVIANEVLGALRGMTLLIETDGQIVGAWGAHESLIGRTAESLVGTNAIDLVCDHHVPILLEVFARDESEEWAELIRRPVPFVLDLDTPHGGPLAVDVYASATAGDRWAAQLLPRSINPNALDLIDLVLDGVDGDTLARAVVERTGTENVGFEHQYVVRMIMNPGTDAARVIGSVPDEALDDALAGLITMADTPLTRSESGTTVMISVDEFGPTGSTRLSAAGFGQCSITTESDDADERWCLVSFMERSITSGLEHQVSQTRAPLRRVMRSHLERARAERILERAASTDSLTGLLNHAAFSDALTAAGTSSTVLFIDVDRFKSINDRHGHVVGDSVLVELARRISGAVRTSDIVARLGGDEFAVLLADSTEAVGHQLAREVTAAMRDPIVIGSARLVVGVTVGVASSERFAVDTMLAAADRALYEGKRAGRGRLVVARDEHDRGEGPAVRQSRMA